MPYKITQFKDKLIDDAYDESIKKLNKFYEVNWEHNKPHVFIVDDRKTIDSLARQKTEDWVKAWAQNRTVFMLNRKNLEKESSHIYRKEKYLATVNHELSHLFFSMVNKFGYCPTWFKEGLAIYTSKQNKWKKPPEKFATFLNFDKKGGSGVYYESGFVIDVLVRKFRKKRLLNLIKQSKNSKNGSDFKRLFAKIYKFNLNFKNINNLYNQQDFSTQ